MSLTFSMTIAMLLSVSMAHAESLRSNISGNCDRNNPKSECRLNGDIIEAAERKKKVLEIQRSLNTFGYEVKANGVMDKATVISLKKFQRANNIEPTGEADPSTMAILRFGPHREPGRVPASIEPETDN